MKKIMMNKVELRLFKSCNDLIRLYIKYDVDYRERMKYGDGKYLIIYSDKIIDCLNDMRDLIDRCKKE
jgi:hypothetical protein